MGSFLKQFGTAIYETRAWAVYGEGPTKMGGGAFTAPTAGTPRDVRYTASKDGDAVYAILLGWPGNGQVSLSSVTTARFPVGTGKVFLFAPVGGSAIELPFTQDASGLYVTLPSAQPYTAIAYAMKISKRGTVPAPTPTIVSPLPDGGSGGAAGVATGKGGSGCGCAFAKSGWRSSGYAVLAAALTALARRGRRKRYAHRRVGDPQDGASERMSGA